MPSNSIEHDAQEAYNYTHNLFPCLHFALIAQESSPGSCLGTLLPKVYRAGQASSAAKLLQ